MISIITAIYNQLDMNKFFYEYIAKNTHNSFELIVIDNGSDDGSAEYFEAQPHVKVIRNGANYSYPVCQNQGIAVAKYEYLAFLNNDIIVPKDWDKKLIEVMEVNGLDVVTPSGIEKTQTPKSTKYYHYRWKFIKGIIGKIYGFNYKSLLLMHRLMYGDWDKFSASRWEKYNTQIVEGFVGNSIFMKKSAIEKIGPWDERLQAADRDLFLRVKKRSIEVGDIRAMGVALGLYHHHYIRLTAYQTYPPFIDKENLIGIDQKWSKEEQTYLLKDIIG